MILASLTQATRDTDGNDRRSPSTRKRETADSIAQARAELDEYLTEHTILGNFRIR